VTIEEMAGTLSPWLAGGGAKAESVVSSRVRLARNLEGLPFAHRANPEDLEQALSGIEEALKETRSLESGDFILMSDLDDLDRQFLVERHLISHEHANESPARAVAVSRDETISVMINEEDHLRMQCIQSGFQVMDAWKRVDGLDGEVDAKVNYAFSYEWGYLTACPTNTGTGLRASVLVHLPALVTTGQKDKVLNGIGQMGLAVRGFYGEGSEVMGNIFQISNRTALGSSEIDIVQSLQKVVGQVLDFESRAREILLRDARSRIEDKVWRAYGILKYCRRVNLQEVMSLTSAVRLGLCLGMIDSISAVGLNSMVFMSQPAHLQKREGRRMATEERETARADMVRRILAEEETRASAG
jgi:protein arginine kinase